MAYNGFLLKIGGYTLPGKYIKAETYSPYLNMQDVDPWTDGNGELHRNPVDLKVAKVEFETPALLTNTEFNEIMSNIRANYINAKGREVLMTAYIPEIDDYVTQRAYIADIKPTIYLIDGLKIKYNPIRFSIIGGVYDG